MQVFDPRALPPALWALIIVWSLVWKGAALWRAARAGQTGWFVALLVLSTVGLLEIVYLVFFSGRRSVAAIGEGATPWSGAPPGGAPLEAKPQSPSVEDGGSRAHP
jgi:methionyl-tRNA synthetase